eukprot:scaffold257566_cov35-Tisochrysis_lutea.AAC.1
MFSQDVRDRLALRCTMAVTTFPLHDVSEVMEENAVRPGTKEGRASGSVTHVTTVASDSGDDVGVGRQLYKGRSRTLSRQWLWPRECFAYQVQSAITTLVARRKSLLLRMCNRGREFPWQITSLSGSEATGTTGSSRAWTTSNGRVMLATEVWTEARS